jgi:hypothetical protein
MTPERIWVQFFKPEPLGDYAIAAATVYEAPDWKPFVSADLYDAVVAERDRLREALEHMQWCRSCAEGSWEDCEEGAKALAALSHKEGGE